MKTPFPPVSAAGALAVIAAAACATTTVDRATPSPAGQATADSGRPTYAAGDVHFMTGMIHHHAQAVLMAGWAPTHGASQAVRTMCERIVVGQRDEIVLMERWLRVRHQAVPETDTSHHTMPGMDHSMMMPGMLSAEQMGQLDRARGPEFDRLFLQFMIRHHQGAVTMVDQLFGSQGAGEEETVFRIASDVYADQTTEIDRMQKMLAALLLEGRSPS